LNLHAITTTPPSQIGVILHLDDGMIVLHKICDFGVDVKFRMVATAEYF